MLTIKNLTVSLDGKTLLSDINMHIARGARHLLSGHNGSGKSSLAQTIMGNPEYKIESGEIIFNGINVTNENTTTRALHGLFLGSQNVPEIPGLSILSFLKHSAIAHHHFQTGQDLSMGQFLEKLEEVRELLNIPKEWLNRGVNVGFSGGERKRLMLLQLMMTAPKLAILDEPDSGADASVQAQIVATMNQMSDTTFLFISHQQSFTDMVSPTDITTLSDGKIMIK